MCCFHMYHRKELRAHSRAERVLPSARIVSLETGGTESRALKDRSGYQEKSGKVVYRGRRGDHGWAGQRQGCTVMQSRDDMEWKWDQSAKVRGDRSYASQERHTWSRDMVLPQRQDWPRVSLPCQEGPMGSPEVMCFHRRSRRPTGMLTLHTRGAKEPGSIETPKAEDVQDLQDVRKGKDFGSERGGTDTRETIASVRKARDWQLRTGPRSVHPGGG